MQKLSLTQSGNYVAMLMFLVELFNLNILQSEVTAIVGAIGVVISFIGRYRHGDLTLGGFKK